MLWLPSSSVSLGFVGVWIIEVQQTMYCECDLRVRGKERGIDFVCLAPPFRFFAPKELGIILVPVFTLRRLSSIPVLIHSSSLFPFRSIALFPNFDNCDVLSDK